MFVIIGLENIPELAHANEPLKETMRLPLTKNIVIADHTKNPNSAFTASDLFGLSHIHQTRNNRPKFLGIIAWSNNIFHDDFFIINGVGNSFRVDDSGAYLGNNPGGFSVVFESNLGHRLNIHRELLFFLIYRAAPMLGSIDALKEIVVDDYVKPSSFGRDGGISGLFCSVGALSRDIDLLIKPRFFPNAIKASMFGFASSVFKLALTSEIQADSRDPQSHSRYGKNASENGKPLIISRDGFFDTFLWGVGIGLTLFLSGCALVYRRVRNI